MYQFALAGFIMGVGLCLAGAGTHLYQGLVKQQAMLRYDGKTYLASVGNVLVSFICGPYLMLQLGWRQEPGGAISAVPALVSALVAFGWAFITGLLAIGIYVSILG